MHQHDVKVPIFSFISRVRGRAAQSTVNKASRQHACSAESMP